MISLIIKRFIKDSEKTNDPGVRLQYGQVSGGVGIGLNLILFIGKLIAGLLSNSIAITADALNNLSDAGSSVIMLVGFRLSGKKPDPDHPYGHGRMEYISGLLVSVMILMMGFELIKSSIGKIIEPVSLAATWLTIAILVVSILVKLYMYSYNMRIGRLIDSEAMKATASDSRNDVIATSAVLLSTVIGLLTELKIDGWCGLLVGLFVLYSGFKTAMETIGTILGKPPEKSFINDIERLVLSHEGIVGVHDIIVHDYGPGRVMISLHAEVPSTGNLLYLHEMIDDIEVELEEKLGCQAVIHMDPVVQGDIGADSLKKLVSDILEEIDPVLHMHDFRAIQGTDGRKVIFDVVAPYDFSMNDNELKNRIRSAVRLVKRDCYVIVRIDHGD